ncbi:MAG TPA: tyrosine-type recombinase/integrase [Syntrophales bacterium]|nr:tyrosine-type recombinase/integrase [Syntrophales bacterium]
MATRKLKHSWWVDFRFEHIRYRKRSPENSKAGAETYESVLKQRLARGESIADIERKSKACQSFERFAWEWFNVYVKSNNKFSEIRSKKMILKNHLIPHFGKTGIGQITSFQVEQFKSQKKENGLTDKSINNFLTVLSKSLKTADEWYGLGNIPKIRMLKAAPQRYDFLTLEESETLLSHAEGIWHEMLLMGLKAGLRYGEIRALEWSDINWGTGRITIRRAVYRDVIDSPKSNKERHIPMTSQIRSVLEKRKKKSGFVFADEKGYLLEENKPRRALIKICRKAGLREIGWHVLRHTFASHLVMAGASLKAIQELLGHSSIQTTMRYAHLSPSALEEAVNLLETNGSKKDFGQPVGNSPKEN